MKEKNSDNVNSENLPMPGTTHKALKRGMGSISEEQRAELAEKVMSLRSPRQRDFVLDLLNSLDPVKAFSENYPNCSQQYMRESINKLLRHPKIKEIIAMVTREALPSRQALAAWRAQGVLEEIMNESKSDKARVQAAKIIQDHALGKPTQKIQVEAVDIYGGMKKEDVMKGRRIFMERSELLRGERLPTPDDVVKGYISRDEYEELLHNRPTIIDAEVEE